MCHRCPALELGLRSLRKGESGLVRCEPRFAFGAAGRPAALEGDAVLPPDSHVEFRVRVIELGVAGEPGPAEQLEEGQRKRSLGNFHFQYFDFEKVQLISYFSNTCASLNRILLLLPARRLGVMELL